jgi:hypothetical protein
MWEKEKKEKNKRKQRMLYDSHANNYYTITNYIYS